MNAFPLSTKCGTIVLMEFQKIVNFLDTTSHDEDLTRFVTKKWIEVYDQSGENYNVNKKIRIKTPMRRWFMRFS